MTRNCREKNGETGKSAVEQTPPETMQTEERSDKPRKRVKGMPANWEQEDWWGGALASEECWQKNAPGGKRREDEIKRQQYGTRVMGLREGNGLSGLLGFGGRMALRGSGAVSMMFSETSAGGNGWEVGMWSRAVREMEGGAIKFGKPEKDVG